MLCIRSDHLTKTAYEVTTVRVLDGSLTIRRVGPVHLYVCLDANMIKSLLVKRPLDRTPHAKQPLTYLITRVCEGAGVR